MGPARLARRSGAILLLLAGLAILYFAVFLLSTEVVPQVRETGLSLTRNNMILNRYWPGNQLYLLIALYAVAGLGLGRAALGLWRIPGAGR